MSYNISRWQTKTLTDLVVPLAALYDLTPELIRTGWRPAEPVILAMDAEVVRIKIACGEGRIEGDLTQDKTHLAVTALELSGEGSGTFWHAVLRPALQHSTGHLVAVRIWESGDSLDTLEVHDGQVTETPITL